MKILRVFPRRTEATPTDEYVVAPSSTRATQRQALDECLPKMDILLPEIDVVQISVVFTYDMWIAENLYTAWSRLGVPVSIGGPAIGKPSGRFIPGLHVKEGITITSRGCPNKCWFCNVWRREPKHIELKIKDGWNVMDDNLLAASDEHVKSVFEMLMRQERKPRFTGGLEAKILKPWHCEELKKLSPERMYFAYDTADDYEPLVDAGKKLKAVGFTEESHVMSCYVLIGYKGDTFEKAERRIHKTIDAGFMPFAMLYRNDDGVEKPFWKSFQREWCSPIISASNMAKYKSSK